MGTMLIPDRTGHTTVTWRPDDAPAVAEARARFDELVERCCSPFARVAPGEYEPLAGFDVEAEEILWVRPLQGG